MLTKYDKHANQKVHRWNLVTEPKTQDNILSLKSNRNFILELALKFKGGNSCLRIGFMSC